MLSHRPAFALTAEIRRWVGAMLRETRVGFGFGFGFGVGFGLQHTLQRVATTVIETKVVQSGLTIAISLLPT